MEHAGSYGQPLDVCNPSPPIHTHPGLTSHPRFEGATAWRERDWPGTEVRIGKARLRVIAPTTRCPATAVNPSTAARDLDIPRILQKEFGHNHMGVYAEVAEGGVIAPGAPLAGVLP